MLQFIIGFFIGVIFGVMVMALMVSARFGDDQCQRKEESR